MPSAQTLTVRFLICLYLLEGSSALLLAGIYKASVHDGLDLGTRAGVAIVLGGIGALASIGLLAAQWRRHARQRARALALGLSLNLFVIVVVFALAEVTLRFVAKEQPEGVRIASITVRPTWEELLDRERDAFARRSEWAKQATPDSSYFVFDRELGWAVGSNRQARDGMYLSSVEGVRCGARNVHMAAQPHRRRVAIIGDSNAFSAEVPFEQSMGCYLHQQLGDDIQVLNFGVNGYGIDQVLLHYTRDVQPWSADVVLVGCIGHDVQRALAVYPFLSFGWHGHLVKPRFVVREGKLTLLNLPLPSPERIMAAGDIHELPYVEYDLGYQTKDWFGLHLHLPMVLRVLTSGFPRYPEPDPVVSPAAAQELCAKIFTRLVGAIEDDGSVAIVALLCATPDRLDHFAERGLESAGIPFMEFEQSLGTIPEARRFVPSGVHFSGIANEAIARELVPKVREALARSSG